MASFFFVLKKFLTALALPLGLGMAALFIGLALARRRWARTLAWCGFILIFVMSLPLVSGQLTRLLESGAGDYASPRDLAARGVRLVVVLSGNSRAGNLTAWDRLGYSGLRVVEGVRLWKGLKHAKLIVSGGWYGDGPPPARAMAALARQLGVPAGAVIIEDKTWDTASQAKAIKPLVGSASFALVTSAYHLPRALAAFRARGLNPIGAPCAFRARRVTVELQSFLPSARALHGSSLVIKEYLGRLWLKLAGT